MNLRCLQKGSQTEQNWLLTDLCGKLCCQRCEELTETIRKATTDPEVRAESWVRMLSSSQEVEMAVEDEFGLNVVADGRVRELRGIGTER